MISIIITSFKEPGTICKAIESFAKQKKKSDEILVLAPDEETLKSASKLKGKISNLKIIRDSGNGKPAALNLAVSKAKGDILVLSDGDVYVGPKALSILIKPLENKKIGAVSGQPVSVNSKDNIYGYWAYVLTKVANDLRINSIKNNKQIFCSGYLFAIRKSLFPKLSDQLLSEDGFISNIVYKKGYKIDYTPESKVFVKYPTNFKDWIKQKKRSAGGYNQIKSMEGVEMRSFKTESKGIFSLLKYVSGPREFIWLATLALARIYLWLVIYLDINLRKRKREELWKPVESTK